MALGFALLFATLLLLRMRTGLLETKARAIRLHGVPARRGAARRRPPLPAPSDPVVP
jgi:hypothetical protein